MLRDAGEYAESGQERAILQGAAHVQLAVGAGNERAAKLYDALKEYKASTSKRQALDEHRGYLSSILGGKRATDTSEALGLNAATTQAARVEKR